VDALHSCKQAPGKSVSAHVLEMKGYMDQLHALGKSYENDMAINLINKSLNKDFGDFVRNFNMHCVGKIVTELQALLIDYVIGEYLRQVPPFRLFFPESIQIDKSILVHSK
nr:zinc finger, CCHC-type [Tanacetum cinerariifolium]